MKERGNKIMADKHLGTEDLRWYIETNEEANSGEGYIFKPGEKERHDSILGHLRWCKDCQLRGVIIYYTIKSVKRYIKKGETWTIADIREEVSAR
jgi:hypothetical protein